MTDSAIGKLTTHVLDTAFGCPAAHLKIELWQMNLSQKDGSCHLIKTITTNLDGRCDAPLLSGSAFTAGIYELRFAVGDYFMTKALELPSPLFLDIVPLRFGIADASVHYHVPLLCSPWAYSTYRGS